MGFEVVLTLVGAAVLVGAAIQGSFGFGYALVLVPTLALLYPEAIPVTPLLLLLVMTSYMTIREWGSIDVGAFFFNTCGRVLGAGAGAGMLQLIPAESLSTLLGLLIVAAALLSFFSPSVETTKKTQVAGGIASGIMGTTVAIGGPPLALIYQDRPGPQLRATLAVSFGVGAVASLSALAVTGRVEGWHFLLALELLPALLIGLWVSKWAIKFLEERWLRPAVLTFAALAGVVVIILGPLS
jgi:uncharacterized membrane protein YfcA